MLKSSEFDFSFTSASLIKYVGTSAGIDDVDFITPTEVRHKLAATDPETSRVLEAFLVAFQEWFEVTSVLVTDFDEDATLTDDQILASNRRTQCKVELNNRLVSLRSRTSGGV
jgi:hypothetical protein